MACVLRLNCIDTYRTPFYIQIIEANLCSERDQHVSANAVENQTDSLEHVSKTLDEMALNKSADSEPTSGLNTDSIPPLQCILSQRVVHHRARDMTLLACWNEFVMDYGHYFVDDEAPVIVLPPSMGGTSDVGRSMCEICRMQ